MEHELGLRVMYGAAIFGAGTVGVMTLTSEALARQYVFGESAQIDAYLKVLGAIWAALGALAVAGLLYPSAFVPILLLQLVYKSIWLICVAIPAFLNGNREPAFLFLTILFLIWVVALLAVVPFGNLTT